MGVHDREVCPCSTPGSTHCPCLHPKNEKADLWERVAALPVLRLRTRTVVGGSGPDTYEGCVRVADLRAAGLLPPAPPPTCAEDGCDLPRATPEVSPLWCEPHGEAIYAKQRDAPWRRKRSPRSSPAGGEG